MPRLGATDQVLPVRRRVEGDCVHDDADRGLRRHPPRPCYRRQPWEDFVAWAATSASEPATVVSVAALWSEISVSRRGPARTSTATVSTRRTQANRGRQR